MNEYKPDKTAERQNQFAVHLFVLYSGKKTGMGVKSPKKGLLHVFLQPFNKVVCHTLRYLEVSWPHVEHQRPVKSRVVVVVGHLNTRGPQPRHIHDPIISKDVVLTRHDVGLR